MSKTNTSSNKKELSPKIYAYSDSHPQYAGLLKVGYASHGTLVRIKQQYAIKRPGPDTYTVELEEDAIKEDGSTFSDHLVHKHLVAKKIQRVEGEWFKCTVKDVQAALIAIKSGKENIEDRDKNFKMRPEQEEAVEMTYNYFKKYSKSKSKSPASFLWNAKMRFGKTFAAYKLAQKMNWTNVLVLTFKPAVKSAWQSDLNEHIDFEGWQFIAKNTKSIQSADRKKPIVCFGSFQDYLGTTTDNKIKELNRWVHNEKWDCVIIDEYHFGAWRENAKELFESEESKERNYQIKNNTDEFTLATTKIESDHFLYLSGTPFRALDVAEFLEDQIFNWTYQDEQKAKADWKKPDNPYSALPKMTLYTYQMPEEIINIAKEGENDEFDLNVFFAAEGQDKTAEFTRKDDVQKWLNLIRGGHLESEKAKMKVKKDAPAYPFADVNFLSQLSHTFWFMPSVASCYAMRNLLKEKQNKFYQNYEIIVAAGTKAGIGEKALEPVNKVMQNAFEKNSITLSCGKLTTGVTVAPWTGILMLRNLKTPETYFQSAFRVQSPWVIDNEDNKSPKKKIILKSDCYIFDFAPNRALEQIANYCIRLDSKEKSNEKKVGEFIKFLPVIACDGAVMKEIDAVGVLDMAISGTTATMLARRWQSALLVNVDNKTLENVLNNKDAMAAIANIQEFRALNNDIRTIINLSKDIKSARSTDETKGKNKKTAKGLSDAEKEYRERRKEIQDKLIKFATRIPIFMYLTDEREKEIQDIIKNIEPGLFTKVTGLTIRDFDVLVELNLFNKGRMNHAVDGFRRYEEKSLEYIGIKKDKANEEEKPKKPLLKTITVNTKSGPKSMPSF